MNTNTHNKRIAQNIMREMLDQGVTPNGNLQQIGEHHPLFPNITSIASKARKAAMEAARQELSTLNNPALMELISSELEEDGVGTLLSDVIETQIQWLWQSRLAIGKISTLDGDPGLGKSTITLDIAARITTGRPMPDNTPGIKGGVVLISPEDSLSDTVLPRLNRAGANLKKADSIGTIETNEPTANFAYERHFSLPDDVQVLEDAIKRVDAKLVIIDPIMAILGTRDIYKDNEVRAMLAPIKTLVERTQTAVIMVRHFTKGGGDHAIYRGGGSMAFIGLARTGFMVTKDPEDETRCVLANIKNNLCREASSLTYLVSNDEIEGDGRPYIAWQGVNRHSIKELLSTSKPGESRQKILQALRDSYPEPMTPKAIAEACDLEQGNVHMTLKRMAADEQVLLQARGLYTIPYAPSS